MAEITENENHRTVKTVTEHGTYIYSVAKVKEAGISKETKEAGKEARLAELRRKHGK